MRRRERGRGRVREIDRYRERVCEEVRGNEDDKGDKGDRRVDLYGRAWTS